MIIFIAVILLLTLIIYKIINNGNVKTPNTLKKLPSAPGRLPIVGNMFNLGSQPYQYLTDISAKVGPIYKIQLGWKEIVVLNNYELLHKALKEDGINFAGRWRNTFSDQLARYCGLIFKEKEWWSEQRSFTLQVLKDFGFGKSQTESVILREAEKMVNIIKLSKENPVISADLVAIATMNIISDFIMSKEFQETDPEIVEQMRNIRKFSQSSNLQTGLINLFPIFKYFPNIENRLYILLDSERVIDTVENVYKFINRFVEEHRENFQPSNECRDLIDKFLLEQHKLKLQNKTEHSFTDFQIIRLISELFVAGFETTSTTLTWSMLILSRFPDIQRKMHDEVVEAIGLSRYPAMADKKSLHYFQAAMDEILRFATIVPLSLPHKVFNDCSINGFFVPGESIIFPNIYACHRDPKVWEKPYDFYPEHFLTADGKYNPRPDLIPFGIGKRVCLGESLAKMEYFILLATIVQRFRMSLDDITDKKDNITLFQGTGGIVRGALEHKIIFKDIRDEK